MIWNFNNNILAVVTLQFEVKGGIMSLL